MHNSHGVAGAGLDQSLQLGGVHALHNSGGLSLAVLGEPLGKQLPAQLVQCGGVHVEVLVVGRLEGGISEI